MKALLFTILLSVLSSAASQLLVKNITPLDTYNHKPSMKLKKQREFRFLSKIKKKEAIQIAASLCKQNVVSHTLTHKKQLLFYRIYTEGCKVEINALSGDVISKVLL